MRKRVLALGVGLAVFLLVDFGLAGVLSPPYRSALSLLVAAIPYLVVMNWRSKSDQ